VQSQLPDRVGGRPALDFVNTVDPRHDPDRRDYLTDYAAVLAWAGSLDLPLPAPIGALGRLAAMEPDAAAAAHRRAVQLRESLYAVFAAVLTGREVPDDDLAVVNSRLRQATDHHLLRPDQGRGVRDGWVGAQSLDSPLWPVIIDAWDLLTEDLIDRVRECPGEQTCGWLFLDTSRSGNRRWCDMRTCGNRAKVRTHYTRSQGGTARSQDAATEPNAE
jgi:predicted RNA-binding Zn ribbon-like protein